MEQALLLHGHRDFTDVDAYSQFVADVYERINSLVKRKFTEERKLLMALQARRSGAARGLLPSHQPRHNDHQEDATRHPLLWTGTA